MGMNEYVKITSIPNNGENEKGDSYDREKISRLASFISEDFFAKNININNVDYFLNQDKSFLIPLRMQIREAYTNEGSVHLLDDEGYLKELMRKILLFLFALCENLLRNNVSETLVEINTQKNKLIGNLGINENKRSERIIERIKDYFFENYQDDSDETRLNNLVLELNKLTDAPEEVMTLVSFYRDWSEKTSLIKTFFSKIKTKEANPISGNRLLTGPKTVDAPYNAILRRLSKVEEGSNELDNQGEKVNDVIEIVKEPENKSQETKKASHPIVEFILGEGSGKFLKETEEDIRFFEDANSWFRTKDKNITEEMLGKLEDLYRKYLESNPTMLNRIITGKWANPGEIDEANLNTALRLILASAKKLFTEGSGLVLKDFICQKGLNNKQKFFAVLFTTLNFLLKDDEGYMERIRAEIPRPKISFLKKQNIISKDLTAFNSITREKALKTLVVNYVTTNKGDKIIGGTYKVLVDGTSPKYSGHFDKLTSFISGEAITKMLSTMAEDIDVKKWGLGESLLKVTSVLSLGKVRSRESVIAVNIIKKFVTENNVLDFRLFDL
jgi:hypothetical protein